MARAEHGSVGELIHTKEVRALSIGLQAIILRDAARGMAYLHAHATRHCNLRAANLLLFDPFVVKVALTITPTLTLAWP